MKRRRRGLGSAPAEHQTRAGRADSNARDAAEHASKEAEGGHCSSALLSLADAYRNLGRRDAELHGAGHTVQPLDKTVMTVERARSAIRSKCLVGR